jgi:hypothetical protein
MKDKLKKYVKAKSRLDAFLDYNRQEVVGYHKPYEDENYNVYLRKGYDLQFLNVLYGVQVRSAAKSVMNKHFDYCDKSDIEILYCNIDSILIKESDLDKMSRFISKEYGYLKIEGRSNKGAVIISQGKFSLRGDDSNKIRNMATFQNPAVCFPISMIYM